MPPCLVTLLSPSLRLGHLSPLVYKAWEQEPSQGSLSSASARPLITSPVLYLPFKKNLCSVCVMCCAWMLACSYMACDVGQAQLLRVDSFLLSRVLSQKHQLSRQVLLLTKYYHWLVGFY